MTREEIVEVLAVPILDAGLWKGAWQKANDTEKADARWKATAALAALEGAGLEVRAKDPPEHTSESVAAVDRSMDWIDAEADKWAAEVNLVAMIKNIASVTGLHTGVPQDAREKMAARAEQMIDALCRQAFLEAFIRCIDSAREYRAMIAARPK